MTVIAHLSDIHFGAVDERAAEHLVGVINDRNIDAVIVTGDLTQAGRKREFQAAGEFLDRFTAPILVVPGNHDTPVYNLGQRFIDPWRRFRKFIHHDLAPTMQIKDVFVVGLNSARRAGPSLDWSRGRLSRTQIENAAAALIGSDGANLKLVALHHPVLPGEGKAGNAIINKPDRAMESIAASGGDAILSGHVHIASAKTHDPGPRSIVIAAAGTASSTRLRGELPSYNLLNWKDETLRIDVHRYGADGYLVERQHYFERIKKHWQSKPA
ncbi:MAG: metallophosphoesterase [Marinicaulis sp.]|nr:metallophosphoesterase [Marinicaulis sp.]NNE39932.1 metallophosphoesterase [Marinicaulis sp.]